MNELFGNSYGRSMSTDSMPSNISEDFSYLQNKISSYQFHSHIPLDERILSEFNNQPIRNGNLQKKPFPLINTLLSPPNQEKLDQPDIDLKNLAPPKVHLPYKSHQKKIIHDSAKERQIASFSEAENTENISKNDHPYDYQNFVKNRLKNLPLEIPLQISPEPEARARHQRKISQLKTDVHRKSRSFDEGNVKHPQESKRGTTNFQRLQSPKTLTFCPPKVISVDKFNEDLLLSGRSSQLEENYANSKNSLKLSGLSQEERLKSKRSPQGKLQNKLNWKLEFDFSNALLDAGKKLNKTQQQSLSISSRKLPEDISLDKTNIQMILQASMLRQTIDNENSCPESLIEESSVPNHESIIKEASSVPQNLSTTKRTQLDKENKTPSCASDLKGRKSTKNIWNNYTVQMRKESKENTNSKENKEVHMNTLFEFEHGNEQLKLDNSNLDIEATTLDKLTSANSKPSTFCSIQEDKSNKKTKSRKFLKKDKNRGSIEFSLPLQMDSKNPTSMNSIANVDFPQGSVDNKFETNNKGSEMKIQSAFASGQNSIQTYGQVTIEPYCPEIDQSSLSLKSRKDEDLSEFIRIEMCLSQEEQAFQPPCLIRNSMVLKKGMKQSLKEVGDEIAQDEEKAHGMDLTSKISLDKKGLNQKIKDKRGFDEQNLLREKEEFLSPLEEISKAIVPNLDIDTSMSTTVNECPSIPRRTAVQQHPKMKNNNSEKISRPNTSKSSNNVSMSFHEVHQNMPTNKKIRDMLSRKNENILIHLLEKSGLNTSSEETNLQNSIKALLHVEQQKNLGSIEVFRSSNRLPTIEEMNSVQIQNPTKIDNQTGHEPEKVTINVSQFSDRCISEPNGFYFKKSFLYEPDFISKSFDDLKCFGDLQNKIAEKHNFTPQSEYNLNHEKLQPQNSSKIRKIQSESKLGSSYSTQHLFGNTSQYIAKEDNQRKKIVKSPTAQLERFRHLFHGKDTSVQSKLSRGNSLTRISRSKEPSFDQRDRLSMSRTYHSKRSSIHGEKSRNASRFAYIPAETPKNVQTYTIVDQPKRSASSDPKLKTKSKPLSTTNLTPLIINLHKKFDYYGNAFTTKDQKLSTGKFGKNLFR